MDLIDTPSISARTRVDGVPRRERGGGLRRRPSNSAVVPAMCELREVVEGNLVGLERISSVVASTRILAPHDGDPSLTGVDANPLVEETIDLTNRDSDASPLLEFVPVDGAPQVIGSVDRLRQVLINRVLNAYHAVPEEDGRVRSTTRGVADDVEIRVEDNGSGVPESLRERVRSSADRRPWKPDVACRRERGSATPPPASAERSKSAWGTSLGRALRAQASGNPASRIHRFRIPLAENPARTSPPRDALDRCIET